MSVFYCLHRSFFYRRLPPLRSISLLLVLLLTACVGPQMVEQTAIPKMGRAATSLLAKADSYVQTNEWELAAAALERALRIEPRNAWLWHHLAVVRFRQGRYVQAISLANKSSSLAPGNQALLGKNRSLIDEARMGAAQS